MVINSIQIKNFRSIVNERISASNITVLVGNNDAGKSNYLKALNLFFNNQTDFNTPFDFERDHSKFATTGSKMAKEITITLEIVPPPTYKATKNILWTKVWRKDGMVKEKERKRDIDNQEIAGGRSRIVYWLDHIVFRYIPAIKSSSYFQELLGDLHDTLSYSVERSLFAASDTFAAKIKESTSEIANELLQRIQIESNLHLPNNLRKLFQTLEFRTKHEDNLLSLNNRGDGIKSRHIPVILKFISEQENKTRTQGAPRITTIWGYEEPENNLELSKSFELARDFYEYSLDIQMFVTTHSPSFYGIKYLNEIYDIKDFDPQMIKLYYISNMGDSAPSSKAEIIIDSYDHVDSQLGLLQLITPHIKDKIKENNDLNDRLNEYKKRIERTYTPTIFVEGINDRKIISKAMELFDDKLKDRMLNNNIIVDTQRGAGANWVSDSVKAWAYSRKEIKIAAILDCDSAGSKCHQELTNDDAKCRTFCNKGWLKSILLDKPPHTYELYRQGISIPITLDEMFPYPVWYHAKEQGWLEERNSLKDHMTYVPNNKSLETYLKEDKNICDEMLIYCLYKVKDDCKEKIVSFVLRQAESVLNSYLENFKPTVKKLKEHFCG